MTVFLISDAGLIVGAIIRYTIDSPVKTSATVELDNLTEPPDFLNLRMFLPNETDRPDVYQYRLEAVVDEAEPELEEKVRILCYTSASASRIFLSTELELNNFGRTLT